jgi:hypothetical protein
MEEMWEDIPGYKGHYQVSNSGKVYSLKSDLELKPNIIRSGYKMVRLSKNGWSRDYLVHRLVAMVFVNNPNEKPVVNHKDGNKINNYFLNLEWCTDSENQIHAIKTGLKNSKKGENHPMRKLTYSETLDIKKRHRLGLTYKQLAQEYKVHWSTIGRIINNQLWRKQK